jgi:hypothetical protein
MYMPIQLFQKAQLLTGLATGLNMSPQKPEKAPDNIRLCSGVVANGQPKNF